MPHSIGAVKRGAMLAYEADVTAAEAHGAALGLFKARIAAGDRRVTMTSVGEPAKRFCGCQENRGSPASGPGSASAPPCSALDDKGCGCISRSCAYLRERRLATKPPPRAQACSDPSLSIGLIGQRWAPPSAILHSDDGGTMKTSPLVMASAFSSILLCSAAASADETYLTPRIDGLEIDMCVQLGLRSRWPSRGRPGARSALERGWRVDVPAAPGKGDPSGPTEKRMEPCSSKHSSQWRS